MNEGQGPVIGFTGLGDMGQGMAANLLRKGYELAVLGPTIANAHKDMRYFASMADEAGALHPVQAMVHNVDAAMEAAGEGQRFVPMLSNFVARQNGLD